MSVELGVVVGIALAVATVIAIIMPLRASPQTPVEDMSSTADLMARREWAFQVLRDLDSDFEGGKLSEEDYRPMRVQSLAQAAEIMAQLDAAQAPSVKIAEPVDQPAAGRRRVRQAAGLTPAALPMPWDPCGKSVLPPDPCGQDRWGPTQGVRGHSQGGARREASSRQEVDKFCPHCGASRGREDEFCGKCGKSLT